MTGPGDPAVVLDAHARPRAVLSAPGVGTARFEPDWWSFSGAMGGTVAATLLDVAGSVTDPARRVRQATFHFLRPVTRSELDIVADVQHDGRASTVVAVTSATDGRPAVRATVVSARPRRSSGRYEGTAAPAAPDPAECEVLALPTELVPCAQHLEFRFVGSARPHGSATAELLAWVRPLADGAHRPGDLAVIADAMPPALFAVALEPMPLPTVEMSLVLTDHGPVEGPVLVRMVTRSLEDAWCVDDCDIWSRSGQLLVQSRQSRLVLADDEWLRRPGVGDDPGVPAGR